MGPCPPAVQVPIGTSPIELFASQHAVEPCIDAEFKEGSTQKAIFAQLHIRGRESTLERRQAVLRSQVKTLYEKE